MKKIIIVMLFCFSVTAICVGQSKFGNVTNEEMEMTVYDADTSAVAVILLKEGDIRFVYSERNGFEFEYSVKKKIKILKTEGLSYCDYGIHYYEPSNMTKEHIEGLSGTTYNLVNGKVEKTKLSKEFIKDEDTDGKYKLKKITMPAAKVGSVIEYKYTLVSPFYYDLRDYDFQDYIPIANMILTVKIPEYFKYNLNSQGYVSIASKKEPVNENFTVQYKDNNGRTQVETVRCTADNYTFKATDVPALKHEPHLWTMNDYKSKISFELKSQQFPYDRIKFYTQSWDQIDEKLRDKSSRFGENIDKGGLFNGIVQKGEPTLERAREIQNMLKSKVTWDKTQDFMPYNLKDVLKKGTGTSADMNLLLINALKTGGLDAYPVILSSRSNGRLPIGNPSMSAFNGVITGLQIDTVLYYTDASAKYGDWNVLPEKVMVPQARYLKKNSSGWVDLTKVSPQNLVYMSHISFEDGKIIRKMQEMRKGSSSYIFRSRYFAEDNQEKYVEKLGERFWAEVSDFSVENLDDTSKEIKASYTLSSDFDLETNIIYFNPFVTRYISENPFKNETRVYPVNFDNFENYRQLVSIQIPKGYVVDELPKSEKFVLENDALTFLYRISSTEEVIQINYQVTVNQLMFLPVDYSALQDFFSKLALKSQERIVLKKAAAN